MERERPEYLPPIERSRWNFPWLITGFLTIVSLATIGVLTLGRTDSAWRERFEGVGRAITAPERPAVTPPAKPASTRPAPTPIPKPQHPRVNQPKQNLRCINGMLFRRIDGGWENLPGSRCGGAPTSSFQCFAGRPYRRMENDAGWVYSPQDRCP